MPNDNLLSITPIDGRYASQTKFLANYFSEFALIKTRVEVEVEWLLLLSKNKSLQFIPEVSKTQQTKIFNIFKEFSTQDAKQVKTIEMKTNHDVKAVVLFIVEKLKRLKLHKLCEFVHFCCTSEDINNLSYSLMLQ
jgi:adenylosuccinate lyase